MGLVFRSVGYRGVALPGVPFDAKRGLIPNERGRVLSAAGAPPTPGLYVTGWIKRGPTGVIGTNKADSVETAKAMLEDAASGATLEPRSSDPEALEGLIRARQPQAVSFADWERLDKIEIERGAPQSRPRVKFISVEDMLSALSRV